MGAPHGGVNLPHPAPLAMQERGVCVIKAGADRFGQGHILTDWMDRFVR